MKFFEVALGLCAFLFAFHADAVWWESPERGLISAGKQGFVESLSDAELVKYVKDEIQHFSPNHINHPSGSGAYFLNKYEILLGASEPQRDGLLQLRKEFAEYRFASQVIAQRMGLLLPSLNHLSDDVAEEVLVKEQFRLAQAYLEIKKLGLNDHGLMKLARDLKEEYNTLGVDGDVEKKREILEHAFVLPELLSKSSAQPRHYGSAALGIAFLSTGGSGIAGTLGGLIYGIATSHGALGTLGSTMTGLGIGIGAGAVFTYYATRQPADFREYARKASKLDRFGAMWVPFKKQDSCAKLLGVLL